MPFNTFLYDTSGFVYEYNTHSILKKEGKHMNYTVNTEEGRIEGFSFRLMDNDITRRLMEAIPESRIQIVDIPLSAENLVKLYNFMEELKLEDETSPNEQPAT